MINRPMYVDRSVKKVMNNEEKFLEKLNGIKALAETKNNRLTTQEVEQYFSEDALPQEQMSLVYDYLMAQRITVVGYTKMSGKAAEPEEKPKSFLTLDEETYLKKYKKDLGAVKKEENGEKEALFRLAIEGEALAKSRLAELYLPVVLEIARDMHDGTVFLGDMVQEGNVSLLLALDLLSDAETVDAVIREEIRMGIRTMMEEHAEMKHRDQKMVRQVSNLDETIQSLKKDRGREITIEELSEYMKISEEEILDIIKLAGEDLKNGE